MKLYNHKSSLLTRAIYPSLVWKIATSEKNIYLTFDDGPTPGVTDKVLELLQKFQAKATFFCIGKNVKKYPKLYAKLISEGHTVGNHSLSHLNGWKTSSTKYIQDVVAANQYIESTLFRPPYGKLFPLQISKLKKHYKIIMWTALSGDFDQSLNIEESLKQLKNAAQPGAIIVFHDSKKAEDNLFKILPEYLEYLTAEGFTIKKI